MMSRLPNASQAIVDDQKLVNYVLNPNHEEGKHKAYIFNIVFGITDADVDELKKRILQEILRNVAKTGKEDKYGKRYSVEFIWTRSGRTATVLTSWIIRTGKNSPRLTSCCII